MANQELIRYLQKLRLDAGLQQTDVAKALGYKTSQFVSNWERGASMPPIKALRTLADLYQVPAETIYLKVEKAVIGLLFKS